VRLWDLTHDPRGLSITVYHARGEHLKSFAFSDEGRRLCTVLNKNFQIWDTTTGKLLLTRELDVVDKFACPRGDVAFSADGRLLAAPSYEDPTALKLWETTAGQEVFVFPGLHHPVRGVALSSDGGRLAAAERVLAGENTTSALTVWDVATGHTLWHWQDIPQRIGALTFSADGSRLATGGSEDGTVRVWDVATGQEQLALPGCEAALSVAFSPDGTKLAAADFTAEKVWVWDATTGAALLTLPGSYALTSVAFSPNGRRLAATGYFGDVRFWDAATGQESFSLNGFAPARQGDYAFTARIVFSPDGRRIASNNWDGTLNIWDGKLQAHMPKHEGRDH
jgi:WD40 repeat protein